MRFLDLSENAAKIFSINRLLVHFLRLGVYRPRPGLTPPDVEVEAEGSNGLPSNAAWMTSAGRSICTPDA